MINNTRNNAVTAKQTPYQRPPGKSSRQSTGQAPSLSESTWKRHLPHIQLAAGYYFVTFVTYDRHHLHPSQKDCVLSAIRFLDAKKYELLAAVIMDDHVHIIINPKETLSRIMHSIKSFTAHEINKSLNRSGKVWQEESYDRVIRNEKEFFEKMSYIANNPIELNLAKKHEDYRWLYVKGWIDNNNLAE
jgi:REP element-mobilizing transposase RayT